jgi:protein O-GlcNAc transferase
MILLPRRLQGPMLLLVFLAAAAGLWRLAVIRNSQPEAVDPAVARGAALLTHGDFQEAVTVLEKATSRRPGDAQAAYLLGMARFRTGELRPAAAALRRSVALQPGFVEGHRRLGQVYTIAREYSLAAASLERARALAPEDVTTLIQLARLFLLTGEVERARDALDRALRQQPESGAAHALMGEVERQSGPSGWAAARREFHRALELDPSNADAHHRLGWLALRANRIDEALSHLREAVRLEPNRVAAWYLLAQAARGAGRGDEARRALDMFQQARLRAARAGE